MKLISRSEKQKGEAQETCHPWYRMENKDLEILVERVISGDKDAFLELSELKYPTAYYQAYSIVRNHHDAEDIAQIVMLSMYENIGNLRSTKAFNVWFQRIVNNKALMYVKKKSNRNDHIPYDEVEDLRKEESTDWLPQENIENMEFEQILAGIIKRLPSRQERAINLYYYEDLSYKEIAEIMDINISTVSSNISRAKEKIKAELKRLTDYEITFEEEEQDNE